MLPPIGAAAQLVPHQGEDVVDGRATTVDDVRDGMVAVHAPVAGPGELEPPADGTRYTLRWATERGQVVLPVVLGRRVRTPVPLWWLEPDGQARREQRRSYVRAPAAGALPPQVELTWLLPEPGTATGDLLDLSEGGLRVRVAGVGCPEGAAVAVRLTLVEAREDGSTLALDVVEHELAGTVLRTRALPVPAAPGRAGGVGGWEVVVQLHEDVRGGNALRAVVFAWERRARQV